MVPNTWYQVLGNNYLVPNYLVPSTWYQVLGTKYLVPNTWCQVLGISIWYQTYGTTYLVPSMSYQIPPSNQHTKLPLEAYLPRPFRPRGICTYIYVHLSRPLSLFMYIYINIFIIYIYARLAAISFCYDSDTWKSLHIWRGLGNRGPPWAWGLQSGTLSISHGLVNRSWCQTSVCLHSLHDTKKTKVKQVF